MKYTLLMTLFTLSFQAHALISQAQQTKIIEDFAKSERRELWVSGHEYVESQTEKFNKSTYQEFLDEDHNHMEDRMSDSEILSNLNCIRSKKCALYMVTVSGEMWGGYGFDYRMIQLNLVSGEFTFEKYMGYAE